jgi:enterochelin esterase-like enzyme
MLRSVKRLSFVLLVLAVTGSLAAVAYARIDRESRARVIETSGSFHSHALARRVSYAIYLPAGYPSSGLRYPVVYFLHGLPASKTAYQQLGWVGDSLSRSTRQAILVVPQAAGDDDSDPEYLDWGPGKNWETALSVELPTYLDSHYRTIADRRGRAIIGVSAGGYGAAILGLQHPAEYAAVESWSGYFRPTDPTGATTLELGSKAKDDDASVHVLASKLARQFAAYPTFFGFYVGKDDPTFVSDNLELEHELVAAGVTHMFAVYPGGHSTSVWTTHAVQWLGLALKHLQRPTA